MKVRRLSFAKNSNKMACVLRAFIAMPRALTQRRRKNRVGQMPAEKYIVEERDFDDIEQVITSNL